MKFGTDMGEYGKWFCNYFKLNYLFSFSSYKAFDDYIMLHNLIMLLTYIVTLYHNIMRLLGMC